LLFNLRRPVAILAAAICATGAAAGQGVASSHVTGGTLNVDLATDVDSTDPALAYLNTSWEIEYATGLKLVNYPDAEAPRGSRLVPEAAAGLPRISNGGRVYDFDVKAGFTRFSNGEPVTARSFAAALGRVSDPELNSPGLTFISDVAGYKVKGTHLVITLSKPAPDFLARMAMPFFAAVPVGLPVTNSGVTTPPSAGPYYIASRDIGKSIVLQRNPHYKGPRPHNVDRVVYTIGNAQDATYLRVQKGESDYAAGGLPPTAYADVARQYGINKGRFFVRPLLGIQYFALNTQRPIFKNNLPLRRAINFAIDRHAMLIQGGYLSGRRADQILPPGISGYKDANLYPLQGASFDVAKRLAKGHTRDGKVVFYTSNRGSAPAIAQVLQFDLEQIGLDVDVQQFPTAVQLSKMGTKGEPYDIGSHAWVADYADPYDFVNVLLDGGNIRDENNVNFSYFDDPGFLKQMRTAASLQGNARDAAYGRLDQDIMWNAAPWVVRANMNNRLFVSKRVGCFTYNPIYATSIAALCLK
jgi:peptide/nickel transport system substrate-binding protein